jgi:hypothetical protein
MTRPWPDQPELPATLAARPRDARRDLPIPPVNEHPDPSGDGSHVDFATINTTISTGLAANRRCSLCGSGDGVLGSVPRRTSGGGVDALHLSFTGEGCEGQR